MDSAADSLLALSETAAALAAVEEPGNGDDRSSSLSELDDDDQEDLADEPIPAPALPDGDSEAETERLEESPDKIARKMATGNTPSKLAHISHVDERPEIESLTDSAISSPISTGALESDDFSEAEDNEQEQLKTQLESRSPTKRKREDDEQDPEEQERSRRRRTVSVMSEDNKSDGESEGREDRSQPSREATDELAEPEAVEDGVDGDGDQPGTTKTDSNEDLPDKKRTARSRSSRRLGKVDSLPDADQELEDDLDAAEESDEAEVDDAGAAAKTEEEQAKRLAAMEALTALERHFAALRDRLFDERIAAINQELAQLTEDRPSHHELLKQLEVVQKYRDDKFGVEQKLLVYKIGALKNKSVAERSQTHSQYYQTVRDLREKHLERLSEHFYRIQRDRFKSDTPTPCYAIPFPEKKSKQIVQQTSYNKEVSILSGLAKYVGFPAAPELAQSQNKELEEDLQKMGISNQLRSTRPLQRMTSAFSSNLTAPTAEEQFLEKNPWANPQHPVHRLGLTRQNSNRSPMTDSFLTPAQQKNIAEAPIAVGSASTIVEHPSAQASSALNTPYDAQHGPAKTETTVSSILDHRPHSASPLDTRRPNTTSDTVQPQPNGDTSMALLASRAEVVTPPPRAMMTLADSIPRQSTASPPYHIKTPSIIAGSGIGGSGRYNLI